jgi:homoserine kinase
MKVSVFVPGSIGNVGPGFDVLGLAVGGVGDTITLSLTDDAARIESITGRDAALIPTDPEKNTAAIAAKSFLRDSGVRTNAVISIEKGLPLAGGLGGSAASSVGGAYAAALAAGLAIEPARIMAAALEAEATVAGRHLDNIAPSLLGGLALVRSVDPIDVVSLPLPAGWSLALVTPNVRVATREARAVLPEQWERPSWVQQMANTAAMVHAFATGDGALMRRALDDRYAEPRRAGLIPRFNDVKKAALDAGAFGCSISGSGPTIFAITDAASAEHCARAMREAFGSIECETRTAPISSPGARAT